MDASWDDRVSFSPLGHCGLEFDLVSRICIESGAYLKYVSEVGIQIWCVAASWDGGVLYTILKSL